MKPPLAGRQFSMNFLNEANIKQIMVVLRFSDLKGSPHWILVLKDIWKKVTLIDNKKKLSAACQEYFLPIL